ncbi:MAG: hypothetical protein DHS20C15_16080 [Planctomycetota bacterium]|nr:MAG: hypothetical protein DHS20C15_16080 [Planctomycetota bacterium]
MARHDLAARLGSLVWPDIRASRGIAGLDALAPLIEAYPPGGVIVFGEGEPGVQQLIAELRRRAPEDLIVAADLERGCGQQVSEFTKLPPAMALAANSDPEAAWEAGLITGREARAAGIEMVFAPVVDVNTAARNPIIATRAFGDDPHRVATLASAFARGLHEGGVLAVAKHFPGHGSTVQDSHSELARVTASEEQLQAVDLVPFRTLIAERVAGVMVGHLEVPALDPVAGRPATASPNVVLDHLRARLGFDGLVVTDALDMGGFRQEPAAPLAALHAGCDVLLMPADPLASCAALADAHARHELSDETLNAAVARVQAARDRLAGLTISAHPLPDDLGAVLLAASLTSHGPALPAFVPGEPLDVRLFGEDDSGMVLPAFTETLEGGGHELAAGARGVGLVITSVAAWSGSSRLPSLQRQRLHWMLEHGQLAAVVVLGSPYEALDLPAVAPAVLAYQATPEAAHLAALALLGELPTPGRLPVGALAADDLK